MGEAIVIDWVILIIGILDKNVNFQKIISQKLIKKGEILFIFKNEKKFWGIMRVYFNLKAVLGEVGEVLEV